MARTEGALERLVRLADVQVRPFQRFERGKEEAVRAHTELRTQAQTLNHLSTDHDIPESAWLAGQKEYVAKGEAAWRASAARYKAMHDADHARGVTDHEHAEPITTDQVQDALQASQRAKSARSGSSRPRGGLGKNLSQIMAENLQADRDSAKGSLENNPLFGGQGRGSSMTPVAPNEVAQREARAAHGELARHAANPAASKEDVKSAAERAVAAAMVASRDYTQEEADRIIGDIQELAKQADQEIQEQAKAHNVLLVLSMLAGVAVSAITGGLGVPILISVIVGLLPTAASEMLEHMIVQRGKGRTAINSAANQLQQAIKSKAGGSKKGKNTQLSYVLALAAGMGAAGAAGSTDPVELAKEVLYRALVMKGARPQIAEQLADQAVEEHLRSSIMSKAQNRINTQLQVTKQQSRSQAQLQSPAAGTANKTIQQVQREAMGSGGSKPK